MTTDTSERGLERLICTALAGHPCEPPTAGWGKQMLPTRASRPTLAPVTSTRARSCACALIAVWRAASV